MFSKPGMRRLLASRARHRYVCAVALLSDASLGGSFPTAPRQCFVCGRLAEWECKGCFNQSGLGLMTTAYCSKCNIMVSWGTAGPARLDILSRI